MAKHRVIRAANVLAKARERRRQREINFADEARSAPRSDAVSRDAAWLYVLSIVWCDAARSEGFVPDHAVPAIGRAVPVAQGCGVCPACRGVRSLSAPDVDRKIAQARCFKGARTKRSKLCAVARAAFEQVRGSVQ